MMKYEYLIIGGGMTAAAAEDGIRKVDANGSIGIISAESDAPTIVLPFQKDYGKAIRWIRSGGRRRTTRQSCISIA
jgi:3-phenylpropionate/trans-cinnamate dioxygenase ferredoxin reductase subunit